jgi:hypothetical protein
VIEQQNRIQDEMKGSWDMDDHVSLGIKKIFPSKRRVSSIPNTFLVRSQQEKARKRIKDEKMKV